MGDLRKDIELIQLAPARPAIPEAAPVGFRMFAPPPPPGLAWRLESAPRFVPLAQVQGSSDIVNLGKATPVYGGELGAELIGYQFPGVPIITRADQFNAWSSAPFQSAGAASYGATGLMSHVTMLGGFPYRSNGYPIAPLSAVVNGIFTIETSTGPRQIERQYQQNSRGVWQPINFSDEPGIRTVNGIVSWTGFPGRIFTPAVPAVMAPDYNDGWNAGADSIASISGNLRVLFSVDMSGGGAVGLMRGRDFVFDFTAIANAFYFANTGSGLRVFVMERGVVRTEGRPASANNEFEIRRERGVVTYSIDGQVVYTSPELSYGELRVGTSIFHGGDGIP